MIEILTPTNLVTYVANYLLQITIVNKSTGTGDIYNVVVNGQTALNTATNPASSTTSIVSDTSATGSGIFATVINNASPGTPVMISVTDLLQQYVPSTGQAATYDLPTLLGGNGFSADDQTPGLSAGFDPTSTFTLKAGFVLDPEPASLSVLAVGTFGLAFARRRLRRKTATPPA
jgi:hypothetical protein